MRILNESDVLTYDSFFFTSLSVWNDYKMF